MDSAAFVRDFVRQNDPDRFFASLFAPQDKRNALLALAAFDAEIASLRGKVREPMAGEIRIRWWQDRIDAEGDSATGNPLADELATVIQNHGLPKTAFSTYLEARLFDLYDDGFPTRGDLEAYCGETSGIMLQLAAMVLDRDTASSAADACGHGGCMATVTQALRGCGPTCRATCWLRSSSTASTLAKRDMRTDPALRSKACRPSRASIAAPFLQPPPRFQTRCARPSSPWRRRLLPCATGRVLPGRLGAGGRC